MDRSVKQAAIDNLRTELDTQSTIVVFRPMGLTVAEDRVLRQKVIAANASMRVIKNTLAKRAVDGTKLAGLSDHFKGPTALIYSNDQVAPAKVIAEFAKTNKKIEIVGGTYAGKFMDANAVKALAAIPSREVLLGQLAGLLKSPVQRIASVLAAVAAKKAAPADTTEA
jgi:large subunit ribosomal protein L10